jgi:protein melted
VGSIRSVKVSKEGRRNIPKAFEIFTNDKTFILKAKDGSNAQEWVQCLSVAKAHNEVSHNKF